MKKIMKALGYKLANFVVQTLQVWTVALST